MPWPMSNCFLRIAGIQSRTTQPASAGRVKYSTSRMNEPLVSSSAAAVVRESERLAPLAPLGERGGGRGGGGGGGPGGGGTPRTRRPSPPESGGEGRKKSGRGASRRRNSSGSA